MELSEEQKRVVSQWAGDGLGLSEIQKKLAEEFDLRMTYMDVRFLVIELGLDLQEDEKKETVADAGESGAPDLADAGTAAPLGGVSVELDRVVKPGAVVSGTVTFSDGVTASWMLDRMGRLAMDANREDYRPGEDDLVAFQQELRAALQKRGL